jgi:hypothetical protein
VDGLAPANAEYPNGGMWDLQWFRREHGVSGGATEGCTEGRAEKAYWHFLWKTERLQELPYKEGIKASCEAWDRCARVLSNLLRDIIGNPFRPVAFSPEWRTDTALSLAGQMYDSRDFGAMPILADALQDAGCEDEDILNHCRGNGPHVRGCWVVDLVLGKE